MHSDARKIRVQRYAEAMAEADGGPDLGCFPEDYLSHARAAMRVADSEKAAALSHVGAHLHHVSGHPPVDHRAYVEGLAAAMRDDAAASVIGYLCAHGHYCFQADPDERGGCGSKSVGVLALTFDPEVEAKERKRLLGEADLSLAEIYAAWRAEA